MDKPKKVLNLILDQGILPLYFHQDAATSAEVLRTLYQAGIRAVEYTNRGEAALDNFLQLRKVTDKELPGLMLGIGTIKSKIDATEFINEGADFVVCPGVIEEVADVVKRNDLLWIPGCMTATEIIIAEDLDAKLIKLFPGSLLGPSYVKAIKEIFPNLLFIPTGGVEASEENLKGWFNSGVCAVGMGSKLISKEIMAGKDYTSLGSLTQEALQMVRKVKQSMLS